MELFPDTGAVIEAKVHYTNLLISHVHNDTCITNKCNKVGFLMCTHNEFN